MEGVEGRLSGREQAKAWALREVWREEGKAPFGLFTFVAARVRKTKNGRPTGDHPSVASVKEFFAKIDGDPRVAPRETLRGKARAEACTARPEADRDCVRRQAAET